MSGNARTFFLGQGDKQRKFSLKIPSLAEVHPEMRKQVERAAEFIATLSDHDQIEEKLVEVQQHAFMAAIALDPDDGLGAHLYAAQLCILVGDLAREFALRDAPPRGSA